VRVDGFFARLPVGPVNPDLRQKKKKKKEYRISRDSEGSRTQESAFTFEILNLWVRCAKHFITVRARTTDLNVQKHPLTYGSFEHVTVRDLSTPACAEYSCSQRYSILTRKEYCKLMHFGKTM
jgi:hypothetical protein